MSSVVVAVRVRPFNQRELDDNAMNVIRMDANTTQILKPGGDDGSSRQFTFDHSFWSHNPADPEFATQRQVYEQLGLPILNNAFEGFNSCLFAYGQTGSGKTYTMMGYGEDTGVVPRLCKELFDRTAALDGEGAGGVSCSVRVSYLEIYNEKCRCLLNPKKGECRPREHPATGPYVDGLTDVRVGCFEDMERLMDEGNKTRTVAATAMNATSSRSHGIFTINFVQLRSAEPGMKGQELKSKINLVDLAGSERAAKTGATGATLKEGANINKSLVCLGRVIAALAEAGEKSGKGVKVPFRDSVLTWILKENLGGNCKTVMLAAVSPHAGNYEESLSTLRYADRAKQIKTNAVKNEDPTTRKIRELTEEVERLKKLLSQCDPATWAGGAAGGDAAGGADDREYTNLPLIQQFAITAKALQDAQMSPEEQEERDAEAAMERQKALRGMGIGVEVDRSQPSLVNLNEDPFMNECLVYYLRDGATRIGSGEGCDEPPGVILHGGGIYPEHCEIVVPEAAHALPTLRVCGEAEVFVNGHAVQGEAELPPRSRVILGERHVFRFSHPKLDGGGDGGQPLDFAAVLKEKLEAEKEAFKQAILDEVLLEEEERDAAEAAHVRAREAAERRAHELEGRLRELEQQMASVGNGSNLSAATDDLLEQLDTERRREEAETRVRELEDQLAASQSQRQRALGALATAQERERAASEARQAAERAAADARQRAADLMEAAASPRSAAGRQLPGSRQSSAAPEPQDLLPSSRQSSAALPPPSSRQSSAAPEPQHPPPAGSRRSSAAEARGVAPAAPSGPEPSPGRAGRGGSIDAGDAEKDGDGGAAAPDGDGDGAAAAGVDDAARGAARVFMMGAGVDPARFRSAAELRMLADYPAGCEVEAHSLVARPDLNGKAGKVLSHSADPVLELVVHIGQGGEKVAIRPGNLRRRGAGGGAAPGVPEGNDLCFAGRHRGAVLGAAAALHLPAFLRAAPPLRRVEVSNVALGDRGTAAVIRAAAAASRGTLEFLLLGCCVHKGTGAGVEAARALRGVLRSPPPLLQSVALFHNGAAFGELGARELLAGSLADDLRGAARLTTLALPNNDIPKWEEDALRWNWADAGKPKASKFKNWGPGLHLSW